MGHVSIVSGFISISPRGSLERTREAINAFEFDEVWPFSNIFYCESPAQYSHPVVGFAGSYKQVEEVWSEWLWKFGQLLSTLEATDARVCLDCIMGIHSWELRPKAGARKAETIWSSSLGQPWVITRAPDDDFSVDPAWLKHTEGNLKVPDKETGEFIWYKWDRFLERVLAE